MLETITTKPIRVLQLNANTQNRAIHSLLNSTVGEDGFDIVLITEPWWGNIGGGNKGPVAESAMGWTAIIPVSAILKGKRPRAMAYVHKRADFTVTLRSDLANDLDMQILEVQQAPHPTTLIVNIYNDNKKQGKRSAAKRLQKVALPNEVLVILSGDWNLHHPLW
ncbi:Endonuclease/exonuclease/phosphatase, partial [Sparassis latifolia]